MRLSGLVVIVVVALLAPSVARADEVKITARFFDADGWPSLIASFSPDGSRATPSWKRCLPDCGDTVAVGQQYKAGPTAAGTTFEASATVDGVTTTARSTAWNGQVSNTAPPTFDGQAVIGQTLTPRRGGWSGGWGDESSLLGMRACPTAAGTDCRAMTPSSIQPGSYPEQIVLDAAYAGWYVGAVERRVASGLPYPAILYNETPPGQIAALPAPVPGQTVATSPLLGPVPNPPPTPAPPKASAPVAPTRKATIRKRALRSSSGLSLATLACSADCAATVMVRHGSRTITRRVVATKARPKAVTLRTGTFPRRATSLRVTIRFDGNKLKTSGVVQLR